MGQHRVEGARRARERPGDKADAERLPLDVGQLGVQIRLAAERAGIAAADDAQPAGGGDGGRQTAPGDQPHRRTNDRMANAECFRQSRSHGRSSRVRASHGTSPSRSHDRLLEVAVPGAAPAL